MPSCTTSPALDGEPVRPELVVPALSRARGATPRGSRPRHSRCRCRSCSPRGSGAPGCGAGPRPGPCRSRRRTGPWPARRRPQPAGRRPRNAVVGAAVVTTDTDEKPTLSRWYTPVSIRWVIGGKERPHHRVGTGVLHDVELVRGDPTVARPADRHALELAPAVGHGDHVLGAGLRPAHRASETAGEPAEQHLLGLAAGLGPEAAAHIGHDHPDPLRRQVVDRAERVAGRMGALAGGSGRGGRRPSSRRRPSGPRSARPSCAGSRPAASRRPRTR